MAAEYRKAAATIGDDLPGGSAAVAPGNGGIVTAQRGAGVIDEGGHGNIYQRHALGGIGEDDGEGSGERKIGNRRSPVGIRLRVGEFVADPETAVGIDVDAAQIAFAPAGEVGVIGLSLL